MRFLCIQACRTTFVNVDPAGPAKHVDGQDRPGQGGRYARDEVGIQAEAVLLDVDKDRFRALVKEAVHGGHETERGGDDLVPGLDSQGPDGHVQSSRAARAGHAVGPLCERRDAFLETLRERPHRQYVATEHLRDEFQFTRTDVGPCERDLASGRSESCHPGPDTIDTSCLIETRHDFVHGRLPEFTG